MKVLIIGCGLVGKGLAVSLRAKGHHVIGTTTRDSRIAEIQPFCDEVRVLRGAEQQKVHQAAQGCDAIVVCAGPSAKKAMTPEQRQQSYHQILVETAKSVVSAPVNGPIVALSSLSVHGAAANHLEVIDESSPLTDDTDASPRCFQAAENVYGTAAKERACIFRCADIMGADDPPIEDKIKMAHTYLNGSVPFHDEALFYRVHQQDVIRAIEFALDRKLTGIYNLTHPQVPPSNAAFFNQICAKLSLPDLHFRNELKGPSRSVSVDKLLGTGFQLQHTAPESLV